MTKLVVIVRWPSWLKTVIINPHQLFRSYGFTKNIESKEIQTNENIKICIDDIKDGEIDFAQRAMCVTKFKNMLDDLDDSYDVIVFSKAISTNGKIQNEDLIYSKEDIDPNEIQKLYCVNDEAPPPDFLEENDKKIPNETIIAENLPTTEPDDEPQWLKQSEEALIVSTNGDGDILVQDEKEVIATTKILHQGDIAVEITGVIPPELMASLANQRVFVPLHNKKTVTYIGGTKKIPQVGNYVLDVTSYNTRDFSYVAKEKNSTRTTSITRRLTGKSSRGGVARLNSLKRLRR
jgi:hypothetical protein